MAIITITVPTNTLKYVDSNDNDLHAFVDDTVVTDLSVFGQSNFYYTVEDLGSSGGSGGGGGAINAGAISGNQF